MVAMLTMPLSAAATPAAGVIITNQATATYVSGQGTNSSATSNQVQLVVSQVVSFTLAADSVRSGSAGTVTYFPHTLTNTGNGVDTFSLAAVDQQTGFTLSSLQIYADTNGTGIPASNTPIATTGALAAGATFRFIVAAGAPGTASNAASDQIRVNATSNVNPASTTTGTSPPFAPLTDTLTILAGANLSLTTTGGPATAKAGETLSYNLVVRNNGASPATIGPAMMIDGVPSNVVLVRDAAPPNTTLAAPLASAPAGVRVLYHLAGDPVNTYVTVPPTDLTKVDAVGWAIANLAPGASLTLPVAFRLNANATSNTSGTINNNGTVSYLPNPAGALIVTSSNVVAATVPNAPAVTRNYTGPDFTQPADYARLGSNLYLRTDAAACNSDASVIETRTVVITGPNGESETFTATESGFNTGLFVLPSILTRDGTVVVGDKIIEAKSFDQINIELLGCGVRIVTTVTLVDPNGVVFSSKSNAPVAGAAVTLVNGNGAGGCTTTPASVRRLVNGTPQPAPSTVVTGIDGRYEFELTPPGDYCLAVVPPVGYAFASTVASTALPAGRSIRATGPTTGGSYGNNFRVGPDTGPITIDIPVDAVLVTSLFVQKTASRQVVEVADFLDYTVRVRNNSAATLAGTGVLINDQLPAGFAYQRGTARLGGATLADPVGGGGPRLTFNIGAINAGAEAILTYRVRVGPGAMQGDGINRAQASINASLSNQASAKVTVQGGVFSDRGYIVGKVFMDCNRHQVQDDGEVGIPGVRVYLEDGTSAISDSEGKYSFYGITPRTHVLKLDRTSMPAGSVLSILNNRNAGDAGSSFVDLKNGELFKANFAEASCAPAVVAEVEARRKKSQSLVTETDRLVGEKLEADASRRVIGDVKAQPASGTLGIAAPVVPGYVPVAPKPAQPLALPAMDRSTAAPLPPLESMLPTMDNTFAFVGFSDQEVLPAAQTIVRLKGKAETTFILRVNGQEVSAKQVGKKSVLPEKALQAWEYFGIALRPGANKLTATQIDAFGVARGEASITLIAPDQLGKLVLQVPSGAIADGHSSARIVVLLTDQKGIPVTSRTAVTLESSLGQWQAEDLDSREPGVQVFVENGRAEFLLTAPQTPGQAIIRVHSGQQKTETTLDFLPDLRPMIGAGLIEGVLNFRKLDSRALQPVRKQDSFEQEITTFARTSADGKRDAAARSALFLKGRVQGDYLLTLAFDSDKQTKERLFRDIQPDEFYPVYGDAAPRGFDAQSTSKLYVRIDKNKSYLLYGDFTTQTISDSRKLGSYSRSLTGLKQHYEDSNVVVDAFASHDSTRQVVEELRANGTSGPYVLATFNAVENSEKVELLIRDRNQPAIVLKSTFLARFIDYEIEPLTGRILLKAPLPSLDPVFNPQSIRVTYEVDQGGPQFLVAGVEGKLKLTDHIEVGGIAVVDRNPLDPATLRGVNATVRLTEHTVVTSEIVKSDKRSVGSGNGKRLEIRHEDGNLQAQAYAATTDVGFDNPGAFLSRGRAESGGKLTYKLDDKTLIKAEALRTEDKVSGAQREGEYVSVERSVSEHVRVEVGVRHGSGNSEPVPLLPTAGTGVTAGTAVTAVAAPTEFTSVKAKVTAQLPSMPALGGYVEYEQDIKHADRHVAAVGGDYQMGNIGRIYARHEFISSLSGPYALNGTQAQNASVLGIDSTYMQDGHLFSEYRIRDAFSGADTEAAIGLRNLWRVAPGLGISTGFERVRVLSGIGTNEATALTLGLEYTDNPLLKISTRLELRNAQTSKSIFSSIGAAAKLSNDWTALTRNAFALTRNQGTLSGERLQERLQAGVAYRDTSSDQFNALGRVEHRVENDDTQTGISLKRTVELIALNGNYQPVRPLVMSLRFARKWVTDRSNNLSSKYNATLVGARATYDINNKWDLGLVGNVVTGGGVSTRQQSLGVEAGYLLATNLWLSAGYNIFGFRDDDLAGADYTNRGLYIRLRFKFDEDIFKGKDLSADKVLGSGDSK